MKYERIKSVLLVFLVITSVVLTWNLWIFQPTYEFDDEKNVHEVSISDPKDVGDVIRPFKLLLHVDGDHFGIVDEKSVEETLHELSSWTFYDLGEEKELSRNQIQALSQNENSLELIYPDYMPFNVYKGILRFETETIPSGSFDRLIIQSDNWANGDGVAFFISTEEGKVYESHVSHDHIRALFSRLGGELDEMLSFESYELPDGRQTYVAAEKSVMYKYKYYADFIEPDKFQNALFKDPSYVRRNGSPDGEKYTDGTSLMNVDMTSYMIFYINPSQALEARSNPFDPDLLKKSIEFINEHAGWTDNYKYTGVDPATQRTTFQLYFKGYPVFNNEGMSEIKLFWGKEQIYQYQRPYFTLDIPLPHPEKANMPSGKDVLDSLLSDPKIEQGKLNMLTLGYRLYEDPENLKVFILEPAWYYLYDGSWEQYDKAETRGE
ncbi:YycH family regulatory protein [Siminovitchia sediminis]|uniref:YycH family regulatory protein n=1 Tax=Siminovitchia sediminis TaxID=1274353 RepID=A0ABW4KIQ7_9BACI